MVKRAELSTGLDSFEAVVENVEFETNDDRRQYHIYMVPEGIEIKGPTGKLHEWIPMSATCTEEVVPPQSVMDRYLQQVEICIKDAESAKTVGEALGLMKGKKFRFKKMKLGRDYEGNKAKDYFVPVALIE